MTAGPSCANVSGMFVRAPENELNHGADMTLGTGQMEDRFSEAYERAFKVPLLDHSFYRNLLLKNFHPYSYAQLAAEYPMHRGADLPRAQHQNLKRAARTEA